MNLSPPWRDPAIKYNLEAGELKNMNNAKIKLFFVLFAVFCLLFAFKTTLAENNFNPNYIISDSEILNENGMSLEEIKDFLNDKGGYLASYKATTCTDEDILALRPCSGPLKTAAEIIYDVSRPRLISYVSKPYNFGGINPKFLLVLLQKEQSLTEETSPRQSQLDWAAGYGCPDGSSCNVRWQGFWKQVNSASLQFRDYMDSPQLYTYKAGETYTFSNPYSTIKNEINIVTPANQATAALYNYTPHVYNGNYNFYNIWQRYFTREYYDGSLLQAEGEAGVWLIQNGQKRPFLSKSALTSRYDLNKIIIVNKSDIDKYPKGAPIKFQNYSLVRSPNGAIYLLVDNKRHGFASAEAFRAIGYNPEEVMNASWEDVESYEEGKSLTATSTYPTGALLQDKTTGGVYWVYEGTKAPIFDAIFLKTRFKNKKIISAAKDELANYETVAPVTFIDGELLKSTISPAVYLISDGKKRPFSSGEAFLGRGYKWENIIPVSPKVLYLYEEGEPIIKEN